MVRDGGKRISDLDSGDHFALENFVLYIYTHFITMSQNYFSFISS